MTRSGRRSAPWRASSGSARRRPCGSGCGALRSTLVAGHAPLQLVQGELLNYALRTPGHEEMAKWQYQRYADVLATWCREAATRAHETSSLPFERLARVMLAGIDGLILQYVSDPDDARAERDLAIVIEMVARLCGLPPFGSPQPASEYPVMRQAKISASFIGEYTSSGKHTGPRTFRRWRWPTA